MKCACGQVELAITGKPILGAVCYCDDCQAGARAIEALPGAPAALDADGGSAYLLYRRDRVAVVRGKQQLTDHRLREGSPTRRVAAACCNTALYADFEKGHWLSLFRNRMEGGAPPLEMRIQTRFRPEGAPVATDLPSYKAFPFSFIRRLLSARLAMLFGR